MLESEIGGGVAGRSTTNFTHDNRVNDQNTHRYDYEERSSVNVLDDQILVQVQTNKS